MPFPSNQNGASSLDPEFLKFFSEGGYAPEDMEAIHDYWVKNVKTRQQGADPLQSLIRDTASGAMNAEDTKRTDAANKEQGARDAFSNDVNARLQKFVDATMTLDPNDPFAQQVAQAAQTNSSQRSQAQGLGRGGISQYASDLATKRGLGGYQMQRQQMGLSALGNLQNQAQFAQQSAEGRRQFDLGFQNQLDTQREDNARYAQQSQMSFGQGLGAAIGGGLGFLGGALTGNPRWAGAGGRAGASIGAGLGGSGAGSYSSQGPSGQRYSGLGGASTYRNY